MINLLPDDTKQQLRAARTNTVLIRYVIFLVFAVIFLGLACGTSYFILSTSKTDAEKIIASDQTKNGSYVSVLNQINAIAANISKAKSILAQRISYSDIITGLAAILPPGVILDSPLTLTNDMIGTPITLKARAQSAGDETALKANIQKSLLFSNYSLQSLTTNSSDLTGYPVLISIGITINKSVAQ